MNYIKIYEIGGKIAGQKNKESGHIYKIAAENQELATNCKKLSGKFMYIDPDGIEYHCAADMVDKYPECTNRVLASRCKKGNMGFSRREKTSEELEWCKQQKEILKLGKK